MLDDLDRPLGLDREKPPKRSPPWIGLGVGLGLAVCVAGAGFILYGRTGPQEAVVVNPPARQEPQAPAETPQVEPLQAGPPPVEQVGGALSAEKVEMESGVRVFRGGAAAPNSVIVLPPDLSRAPLTAAPDRRLVEKSRYGLLPRRGSDGAAPGKIYARPLSAPLKPGMPRISLLVGGMGLNPAATEAAIRLLPPEVSLAFAPYGEQVERQAAEAREAGHEILLQAPMEPFGRTESPGPHVLRAGDVERATEDLRWQMGRFVGYIGLVNFLGGRFTADRTATQVFMRELAERGLDFVDDGSSPQSLAGEIAKEQGAGFVRADLRLDESTRPEAIDAALFRLETLARQKGGAVGFAAGLPAAHERIARFAREVGRRGLVLVPVSEAIRAEAATSGEKTWGEKR